MEILIDNNISISQIKYIGPSAGGISWNGYETDILKSAIQKYIRRSNIEKALYCIVELDLFNELLLRKYNKSLKAFQTNIFNRLVIISIEDIGIGNPYLPIYIQECINKWEKIRLDKEKSEDRRQLLCEMVYNMCICKKGREISHLKIVYEEISKYKEKYPNVYNFDASRKNTEEAFKELYKENKDSCFYYYFKYENQSKLLDWIIESEYDEKILKCMKILRNWYKKYKYKEYKIYGIQIILIGLRRELIKKYQFNYKILSDVDKLYINNINGEKIEIDYYVIDKHTKQGRKKGKNIIDFVKEGSYVENESEFINQEYKKIYNEFKSNISEISKPSKFPKFVNINKINISNLDNVYRGQLLASKHKKQTFILKNGYVMKGPWKEKDINVLERMVFRLHVFELFDVNAINFIIRLGSDNNLYTIYKNISDINPNKWIVEKKMDNILNKEVYIVNRESMCITQLSKMDNKDIEKYLFEEGLFKDIIIMSLLKCGDVGLYNVLIYDNNYYIVDYEEIKSNNNLNNYKDLFAKSPKKDLQIILEKGIQENKNFIKKVLKNIDNNMNKIKELSKQYNQNDLDINDRLNKLNKIFIEKG